MDVSPHGICEQCLARSRKTLPRPRFGKVRGRGRRSRTEDQSDRAPWRQRLAETYSLAVVSPSSDEKRKLLSRVSLFSGLPARQLDALAGVARTRSLRQRQELFHKGDPGTQVYVVIRGTLKALTTSGEGDDVVFSLFTSGELFGEIAFLTTRTRTATVRAITDSELLRTRSRVGSASPRGTHRGGPSRRSTKAAK